MKYKTQIHILSFFIAINCLFNPSFSSKDSQLEWTDPVSGTYYNFAALKKDPK